MIAVGTAGDRTDDILRSLGEMAARGSDAMVIVHKQRYLRGRPADELTALYREGAEKVGVTEVVAYDSELEGLVALTGLARPGDVIAVMCHQDRVLLDEWLLVQGGSADPPDVVRDKVLRAADAASPNS